MQLRSLLFASCLLSLGACVTITYTTKGENPDAYKGKARPWPAAAQCPAPATMKGEAQEVLALLNAERAKAGLKPVVLDAKASGMAQAFACENAARKAISHEGTDGSSLGERFKRAGLGFSVMAENLAFGQKTPEQVITAWMNSPGHRRNMLYPAITRIGLGKVEGPYTVWVLDLYQPG